MKGAGRVRAATDSSTAPRPSRSAGRGARPHRVPRILFGVAALSLAAAGVAASGCGGLSDAGRERSASAPTTEPPRWTPPTEGGFAAEPLTIYKTVEDLIRRSHFVVIGTVEETVVGEVDDEGIPGNKYPTVTVETTVAVEETLKGPATGKVIVPTQELEFVGAEQDWRVAGHRVLLFLDPSRERDEPIYVLAGLNHWHATYLLQGDEIEPGAAYDVTGLSERVGAMTVPELRNLVERVSG